MNLFKHQAEGVEWLNDRPYSLLADEPGLGKSAQELLVATEPVLVVAPAMVLDAGVWDDEIARWTPDLDVTQVSYTSICQRGKRGKVERDSLGNPIVRLKPEYGERHWGTVIADEAHYLTGRKTSWTHAFEQLQFDRVGLATGTPITNWASGAYSLLRQLYPDQRRSGQRFGSYWRWAREWFNVGPTLWAKMAVQIDEATAHIGPKLGVTWADFYEGNWGDRMLLRLRDDCLDLPPLTTQEWRVKMVPAQRRAYKQLRDDFITWSDGGEEIAAWSSADQMVKLLKCLTGLEVLSGDKGSGKLDALRQILVDRPRQTLVVAHFQDSVEACDRVAQEVGKNSRWLHGGSSPNDRRAHVHAFQRGEIDVLCASIELISEGLTLHQGGADQVVRVERSFRPSKNEQVARRLHRIGVERPILMIDLLTADSLDIEVADLLRRKTDQQMRALGLAGVRKLLGA